MAIPIAEVIKYYNHSPKTLEIASLTPSYKAWLEAEKGFLLKIIPEKCKVLEIGAGNGRIISLLNDKKRNITGIEIANLPFLKEAFKEEKNIKILKMDAHKLGFKDNSFDVCLIMYNTLGLIHNPLTVLKECKRVTKKGGKVIISTYALDEKYVLKERIKFFKHLGHSITKMHGFDFEVNNSVVSHYFKESELKQLFNVSDLNPKYYSLSKIGCVWVSTKHQIKSSSSFNPGKAVFFVKLQSSLMIFLTKELFILSL